MAILQNLWWYLVLIGVMIMIHELGHYWAARLFDVKVETFSFGFGPRLFGFRRGETDFRFSAILFGGYVKMLGEQPGEEARDPRSLLAKPRWQRMVIAFAGPGINVVLAIALLTGLYMVVYEKSPNPTSPVIGFLTPDGAAAKSGIQEGDQIVQIDNTVDPSWEDIELKVAASAKHPLEVWVKRNGERLHIPVTPSVEEQQGIGMAGWLYQMPVKVGGYSDRVHAAERAGIQRGDILVSIDGKPMRAIPAVNEAIHGAGGKQVEVIVRRGDKEIPIQVQPEKGEVAGRERWMIGISLDPNIVVTKLPFNEALSASVKRNGQFAGLIFKFLGGIAQRRVSPKSIEGPFRIAQMSGEAAREGAVPFLGLMAAVSLNLAIFNLLPVPILDGGVMLMLFLEMLMRRDLDLRVKETALKVGFLFLMFIVVFVIYNDLSKMLG
ncbi:MAG: site-2 protease family protein [Bryobacteraceae bacterium]